MKSLKSLLITTSHNKLGDTLNATGVWMEDLAAPYYILKDGGEYITLASPKGGQVPLDANSQSALAVTKNTQRFQQDAQAMYHFTHSLPINEMKAEDFDLVFLVGGYGAMWDFTDNKCLNLLLEDFITQDKPVGLVGHAVVALISLKINNALLVKGKKITGFSNHEEQVAGLNEKPPFLLESKLNALGALYSCGPDLASYVMVDGNIVTGQNPASAMETARQTLLLAHNKAQLVQL